MANDKKKRFFLKATYRWQFCFLLQDPTSGRPRLKWEEAVKWSYTNKTCKQTIFALPIQVLEVQWQFDILLIVVI